MIVEHTASFERNFAKLTREMQDASERTITEFLSAYAARQFPKGLRAHRCGPFLSLSVTMNYRIYVFPIAGGVRFVFIGDHHDAENYLKKN